MLMAVQAPAPAPASASGTATLRPRVLVPCDARLMGGQAYYVLGRKYADALRHGAGVLPILLPPGEPGELEAYLEMADGIFLTGSPANVHPSHFGQNVHNPALPLDAERDGATLPLVRMVAERGLPLMAVCRGLQEMNVAMGGSLHQAVQEVDGKHDHREDASQPLDIQYGPAHEVAVVAGSLLAAITGASSLTVNSLHGQGIDRLAAGLEAQAHAPDGLVEAVRLRAHPGFSLGVQWHPEWKVRENPVSMRIFGAFGAACRAHALARARPAPSRSA
jgi:putative glutamine amidotransferase